MKSKIGLLGLTLIGLSVASVGDFSLFTRNYKAVEKIETSQVIQKPKTKVLGAVSQNASSVNEDPGFTIKKYFCNLYKNSPYNAQSSCAYVSLIQYLSYYDTFYDDSLIPEDYDSFDHASSIEEAALTSPGVCREEYPLGLQYHYNENNEVIIDNYGTDLYNFVIKEKDHNLEAYYTYIYNSYLDLDPLYYIDSNAMWEYHVILERAKGLKEKNLTFEYEDYLYKYDNYWNEDCVNFFDSYVKDTLDKHVPIILHIAEKGSLANYHSVVAYYYDEEGIHCNYGRGKETTDMVIPDDYYILQAGTIDFSNSKMLPHSTNYKVNFDNYCGCGKLHEHTIKCQFLDSVKHEYACICGFKHTSLHFVSEGVKPVNGLYVCEGCNKETEDVIFVGDDYPFLVDTSSEVANILGGMLKI